MRIRHILLSAPADDPQARLQARGVADELIARLQADADLFADLAMRHSACPSKNTGGDMGWLQRGQATPEFDRQVFRLREGLAALPVESRWGYHVVCIDGIAGGEPLPFDEVHERIACYLELQLRQQALQLYLQQLEHRYGVRGLDAIEAQAHARASVP